MLQFARKVESPANTLLTGLPSTDYRAIAERSERVRLLPGQVLLEPGKIGDVYFPLSGVIAKVVELTSGEQVEAGMIGNEGVIPLCYFLKLDDTPFRAVVQNAGEAFRMTTKDFNPVAKPGSLLHSRLLRFTAAFAAQISLAAACSRLHPVSQQYVRWLLMTHNRIGCDEFELTQDTVAGMLGVRRVSVTAVARQLLKQGLIDYRRGKVKILNRPGLDKMSCECYRRCNATYKAILGNY
jgi:CRP-like cAMP-binding protein